MATATLPQRPVDIPDFWPIEFNVARYAQSREGIEVWKIASSALRYSLDRAERVINRVEAPDLLSYSSVPPRRVFHVKVHYVFEGKGQPLPLNWDWDD